MVGGTGSGVYTFDADFGQDVIIENDGTTGSIDTIRFGVGINPIDVIVRRLNADLIMTVGINNIAIRNWFVSEANIKYKMLNV